MTVGEVAAEYCYRRCITLGLYTTTRAQRTYVEASWTCALFVPKSWAHFLFLIFSHDFWKIYAKKMIQYPDLSFRYPFPNSISTIWVLRWLQIKKIKLQGCESRWKLQSSCKIYLNLSLSKKLWFFKEKLSLLVVWNGGWNCYGTHVGLLLQRRLGHWRTVAPQP
jgi:hypothetical protein